MNILPDNLKLVQIEARKAIAPLQPLSESELDMRLYSSSGARTQGGRSLPPYYLVYFLLVDLLNFKFHGPWEKLAWSIPVEYKGVALAIEHRKLGLGIFAADPNNVEPTVVEVSKRIERGVKAAEPYFEWKAAEAAKGSNLNVVNRSYELFERYSYFRNAYTKATEEAERRRDEKIVTKRSVPNGEVTIVERPVYKLKAEASWLAIATIDAFFSWTEHVFIHIAILQGKISTGEEVAALAASDWSEKYKSAITFDSPAAKGFYDQLLDIRRQLRNFIAHGAFGKQGQAFSFHSSVGAVPLFLPHQAGRSRFAITNGLEFDDSPALEVIEKFCSFIWADDRSPAYIYIQEGRLPVILTYACDKTYTGPMQSEDSMREFVGYLCDEWDRSANMDW